MSKNSVSIPDEAADQVAAASLETVKEAPAPRSASLVDKLMFNSYNAEVVKGNQLHSSGWVHGPAQLQMLAAALKRLERVNEQRGTASTKVDFVRAARVKGTKKIYIFPTAETDPDRIPVHHHRSSAWINLVTLFAPTNLMINSFTKERYAIEWAGEDSPVGPAIMFDMGRMLERRFDRVRASQDGSKAPTQES